MSTRKIPILLRESPMTKRVYAAYRYTFKQIGGGREVLAIASNGKQDVTADFDALVLEHLMGDGPKIVEQLDGAAKGFELSADEREEVRVFRDRLIEIVERHNTSGHGSEQVAA